jgi:hypothetical protein
VPPYLTPIKLFCMAKFKAMASFLCRHRFPVAEGRPFLYTASYSIAKPLMSNA